jgi:hypothetical protein
MDSIKKNGFYIARWIVGVSALVYSVSAGFPILYNWLTPHVCTALHRLHYRCDWRLVITWLICWAIFTIVGIAMEMWLSDVDKEQRV